MAASDLRSLDKPPSLSSPALRKPARATAL